MGVAEGHSEATNVYERCVVDFTWVSRRPQHSDSVPIQVLSKQTAVVGIEVPCEGVVRS